MVVFLRNLLFDWQWLSSKSFPVPVVCVGNLEMGGSGKTPMIDLLIEYFHKKKKIACISRGYGRKSTGFVLADGQSQPDDLGDEPFQIFSKWQDYIVFAVDEDRVRGIENLLRLHPDLDLILMDDGMQHRWVNPRITLQLSPFRKPFFNNFLFPAGTLREFPSECKRAQFLIFTKSKSPNEEKRESMQRELSARHLPAGKVFLSEVISEPARNREGELPPRDCRPVAVAGLASNLDFFEKVKSEYLVERCISKPDHYRYLPDFFEKEGLKGKTVICPEKDFHKIVCLAPQPELVYYIPIRTRIFPEDEFWAALEKSIEA